MTVTGMMKFFGANVVDGDATFTFTSATTDNAAYLYDNNRTKKLLSVGSNDATPEVWQIDFAVAKTFTRIFVDNHNIKTGKIEYWDGASWIEVNSAYFIANADTTTYIEFNALTTTKMKITMNTTMSVNAEKYIGEFRCFNELGTVANNPSKFDFEFTDKSLTNILSNGGNVFVLFGQKFSGDLSFTDAAAADMTLFRSLKNSGDPFYLWPCGGTTTYDQEGFRVYDMYFVNYVNSYAPKIKSSLLGIGTELRMQVQET